MILVIGGTHGLGEVIVNHFNADHVSTTTGHHIPEKLNEVVDISLKYKVIINCLPDINQNRLLESMFEKHHDQGLTTCFITIGSMSWRLNQPGHSKRDLFDWNEKILSKQTTVKHTLLNPAYLWNSKDDGPLEKISKTDMIDAIDFIMKHNTNSESIISLLEIKGKVKC